MTRRRLDADTRRRVMQVEAYRHMGRKYAWWIVFGPWVARVFVLAGAVVGLMVLWMKVDHVKLGVGALIAAVALTVAWGAYTQATSGVQRRMVARAQGRNVRAGFGFGWAVAAAVLLLSGTGWLALWSPYA